MRPVVFHPAAQKAIRPFPKDAPVEAIRLFHLADGRSTLDADFPADAFRGSWGVGTSRSGEDGIFRVFYYTASPQGVLVFHAFVKKTQETPPLEIELARKHLKELLDA